MPRLCGRPTADLVPCRRFTACRGFDGLDQLKRRQISQAMLALADGDRAAFDTVFDAVWLVILKFSTRMIGDEHMAEDIAQQTLLKVFSRVSTFNRTGDALNWTLGIAANECRTYLRKTKRTSALTVGLDDASELASAALTPQEQVEKDNLRSAVMAVLEELRPHEVETIVTVIYESQRPGIAAATFRKRWQRAIQSARQVWNRRL